MEANSTFKECAPTCDVHCAGSRGRSRGIARGVRFNSTSSSRDPQFHAQRRHGFAHYQSVHRRKSRVVLPGPTLWRIGRLVRVRCHGDHTWHDVHGTDRRNDLHNQAHGGWFAEILQFTDRVSDRGAADSIGDPQFHAQRRHGFAHYQSVHRRKSRVVLPGPTLWRIGRLVRVRCHGDHTWHDVHGTDRRNDLHNQAHGGGFAEILQFTDRVTDRYAPGWSDYADADRRGGEPIV